MSNSFQFQSCYFVKNKNIFRHLLEHWIEFYNQDGSVVWAKLWANLWCFGFEHFDVLVGRSRCHEEICWSRIQFEMNETEKTFCWSLYYCHLQYFRMRRLLSKCWLCEGSKRFLNCFEHISHSHRHSWYCSLNIWGDDDLNKMLKLTNISWSFRFCFSSGSSNCKIIICLKLSTISSSFPPLSRFSSAYSSPL